MQRIYSNRPFTLRANVSAAIVVFAVLFGVWELWNAMNPGPEGSGYGFMFAVFFIGGGLYGMRQMLIDYAGMVVAMDADGGGRVVISVWRPFVAERVAVDLDRLTNWRFELKTMRRTGRIPTIFVDRPDRKKPLQLELAKGATVTDELRALAPDAFAAFEQSAGPA